MRAFTRTTLGPQTAGAVQACLFGPMSASPVPDLVRGAGSPSPLGTGTRRRWEDDEVIVLRARYPDTAYPVADIAGSLGRSPASVRGKARRLGLRRADPAATAPLSPEAASLPHGALPFRPAEPIAWQARAESGGRVGGSPVPTVAPKPYRVTRLGGRESVWDEDRVRRLIRLWTAGFHHTVVSEVLGVGARAASTKATRISLPARKASGLSRDIEAARRLDAAGREVPKALRDAKGKWRLGKHCVLTGAWFYGPTGVHTCPEAKQTLYYERMRGLN